MGIKMVLSGEGSGQEVFGGYLYFRQAPNAKNCTKRRCVKLQALHMFDCARANKADVRTGAWRPACRSLDKKFLGRRDAHPAG